MKLLLTALLLTFSFQTHAFNTSGEGQIYYVIDGDTVLVTGISDSVYYDLKNRSHEPDNFNDKYNSIKIRIGNINTKESKHQDESRNTKAGEVAANYLKQLMEKEHVKFFCWDIGDYGRPICSVFNQKLDIGQHMIKQGYSDYVTYWGQNPKWHSRYQEAAR